MQTKSIIKKCQILILLVFCSGLVYSQAPYIGFMQEGFNIYRNSMGKGIYNEAFTKSYRIFTFSNNMVQHQSESFQHPAELILRPGTGCKNVSNRQKIDTVKKLAETFEIGISTEASFKGVTGTASQSFKNMKEQIVNQNQSFYFERTTCSFYELHLLTYSPDLRVSKNFKDEVSQLKQTKNYIDFVLKFGTHYIKSAVLGGDYTKYVKSSLYDRTTNNSNSVQIARGLGVDLKGVSAKANMNIGWGNQSTNAQSNAQDSSSETSVGTLRGEDMDKWIEENRKNPSPIDFVLGSITEIVKMVNSDPSLIVGLDHAISNYCKLTQSCASVTESAAKIASCRLCLSCGPGYSQVNGKHDLDTSWRNWSETFSHQCSGDSITSLEKDDNQGISLCCQEESEIYKGSCRYCRSCSGRFSKPSGTIKANKDWSKWSLGLENCGSTSNVLSHFSDPINLCCTTDEPCTLCTSCGGKWGNPVGKYSVDSHDPAFFRTRGNNCEGGLSQRSYSRGISLCCQTNNPLMYKKKKLRKEDNKIKTPK